jgi:hypothetical protein
LPADARDLVRSIELQLGSPDRAELIISWNRIEKFVLAPGTGMRGLRVRVMRTPSKAVLVNEKGPVGDSYSVNLESSREAIAQTAIDQAVARLQAPVYVSEVALDDVTWYRLRAGPFTSRREAERVLRAAQERYPSAWLAIDDERATAAAEDGELTPLPKVSAAARAGARADAALDKALADARVALSRKRLDEAVALLTGIIASEITSIASMPWSCSGWPANARASWPRPRRRTRISCCAIRNPLPRRAYSSGCRHCAPRALPAAAAVVAARAVPVTGCSMAARHRSTVATTRSCAAPTCRAAWSRKTPS